MQQLISMRCGVLFSQVQMVFNLFGVSCIGHMIWFLHSQAGGPGLYIYTTIS